MTGMSTAGESIPVEKTRGFAQALRWMRDFLKAAWTTFSMISAKGRTYRFKTISTKARREVPKMSWNGSIGTRGR